MSVKEAASNAWYTFLAILLVPLGFGLFFLVLFNAPKALLIFVPIVLILMFAYDAGKHS